MSTLNLAIDARQAVQGARQYEQSIDNVTASTEKADDSFDSLAKSMSAANDPLNRVSRGFGVLKGAIAALGIGIIIKDIVDTGVAFENLNKTLSFAVGGTQAAAESMDFLRSEAERLGTDLLSSAEGFAKLSAATKGTQLEGEATREIFTAISEASTVLGLTAEQTGGAITAFEQIISKGKVSAEELRGQLGERLVGAMQIAASTTDRTTQQFDKLLSSGTLLAEDFVRPFATEIRETFAEGLPGAIDTTQAAFNRFTNALNELKVAVAESGLLDLVTTLATKGAEALQSISRYARDLGEALGLVTFELNEASRQDIERRMEGIADKIREQRDIAAQAEETIRKYGDQIGKNNVQLQRAENVFIKAVAAETILEKELEQLGNRLESLNKIWEPTTQNNEKFNTSITNTTDKLKALRSEIERDAIRATERYNRELERGEQKLDTFKRGLEQQVEQLEAKDSALTSLTLEQKFYNLLQDETIKLTREEEFEIRKLIDRIGDLTNERRENERAMEEQTKKVEAMISRLDSAFVSVWENILTGSEDVFSALKSLAIRTLAEIIHKYTTKKVILTVVAQFPGLGGGPSIPGTGGGAGGTASNFLGSILSGGLGGLGIGGLAAGLGIGALGLVAGGLLSGAFGGNPNRRESQIVLGNLSRPITSGAVAANTQSPFGPFISAGLARLGNEGQLTDAQAEEIIGALQTAFDTVAGIDEVVSRSLNEEQIANVTRRLENEPNFFGNYNENLVAAFLKRRFDIIFGEVDEALDDLFLEVTRGADAGKIIEVASGFAEIVERFNEGEQVFSDVSSVVETINFLMEDFALEGEKLIETLDRVKIAARLVSQLGFETGTLEGAAFAADVSQAAGGNQILAELLGEYFNNFFSDRENFRRAISNAFPDVQELLEGIGIEGIPTRESFRQQFEEILPTLEPDEVVQWLEAGRALDILTDLQEQYKNAIIDGSLALDDAEKTVVDYILAEKQLLEERKEGIDSLIEFTRNAIQSVSETTENLREKLLLDTLTDEERFNFFKSKADEALEALKQETDPEKVKQLYDEIISTTTSAWQELAQDQKLLLFDDFDTFLADLESVVTEKLVDAETELVNESERLASLLTDVSQRLDDATIGQLQAANLNIDASRLNNTSAITFNNAANEMGDAASAMITAASNIPRKITVRISNESQYGDVGT